MINITCCEPIPTVNPSFRPSVALAQEIPCYYIQDYQDKPSQQWQRKTPYPCAGHTDVYGPSPVWCHTILICTISEKCRIGCASCCSPLCTGSTHIRTCTIWDRCLRIRPWIYFSTQSQGVQLCGHPRTRIRAVRNGPAKWRPGGVWWWWPFTHMGGRVRPWEDSVPSRSVCLLDWGSDQVWGLFLNPG